MKQNEERSARNEELGRPKRISENAWGRRQQSARAKPYVEQKRRKKGSGNRSATR